MKRVAIGAIVGGLVVFIWGAVSHMLLPLGTMGFSNLPGDEAAVLTALQGAIPEDGLYIFPAMDMSGKATAEEQAAQQASYRSGPTGLLVYHPHGSEAMTPRLLLSELASNLLAAAVAAYLASLLAAAYGRRVLAIALLGLFAWLSLSVSYWIWYGFPGNYILGEGIDQVVGWLLAGLAIARIVPPARAAAMG